MEWTSSLRRGPRTGLCARVPPRRDRCPLSRMCEFMACFAKRAQATPHLAVGKENGAHIAMSALGSAFRIRILMSAQRNTIVVGSAVSRYSRFLAGLPERGDAQGTCAVSRSTEATGTVIDVQGGGSILKRNVLARGDGTGRASAGRATKCPITVCASPKPECNRHGIDMETRPPRPVVIVSMKLAMMQATNRNGA